jgi:hypothetical protein
VVIRARTGQEVTKIGMQYVASISSRERDPENDPVENDKFTLIIIKF